MLSCILDCVAAHLKAPHAPPLSWRSRGELSEHLGSGDRRWLSRSLRKRPGARSSGCSMWLRDPLSNEWTSGAPTTANDLCPGKTVSRTPPGV